VSSLVSPPDTIVNRERVRGEISRGDKCLKLCVIPRIERVEGDIQKPVAPCRPDWVVEWVAGRVSIVVDCIIVPAGGSLN